MWKDDIERRFYKAAYDGVDDFFENLYFNSNKNTTNIINKGTRIDYTGLIYRESQANYAFDIMEAIKLKQILLVQAGVGIGKSFGYLIPIFYTYQNVPKFNKIIIATSNIALQQQLIGDIDKISKMLGIEMKASIAKGINNYACLKRIESWIRNDRTPVEKKIVLENLVSKMEELCTSDKEDLKEFSEKIWQDVQLQSRGYYSECSYSKRCPLYKEQQNVNNSNIIVTNYANLFRNIIDNSELIQDVDMFVLDEAHQIESNMINLNQRELHLRTIVNYIDQLSYLIHINFNYDQISSVDDDSFVNENVTELKREIEQLFSSLRRGSSNIFAKNNKNNHSIVDSNRLPFKYNTTIENQLKKIIFKFNILFQDVEKYERKNNHLVQIKAYKKLKDIFELFCDMAKNDESKNIYWVSFFKENMINLCYTSKKNDNISNGIFSKKVPVICTSGTMLDNKDSYQYFMESVGLENKSGVSFGEKQLSPFDYQNNTLCYYNTKMPSPNDYENYVMELALEIDQLIRTTNGKALILFTSKKCMNEVYHILQIEKYDFNLLLHTDANTNEVKEQFENDVNSCLFATGAFWEGIDIKGKSLSNLIITHLPFDVVDAMMQYKASKYAKKYEQFQNVYIPSMLIKLEQAMGRLIRSDKDTGIVSILDSRFGKYLEMVQKNTQFPNYTSDKHQVIEFVEEKILKDNKEHTYQKKLSLS